MKNSVLMLILAIVFFISGCVNEDAQVPPISSTTEAGYIKGNGNFVSEYTRQENDGTEQNDLLSYENSSRFNDYIISVEDQSDIIKAFLEHEALTQVDMNVKSQELYELWDDALNYLLGGLKLSLPEEEFAKLQDEQRIWIAEKENSLEEAGKEVEGGSIYPLVINSEAAKITEERVYELYARLKELQSH